MNTMPPDGYRGALTEVECSVCDWMLAPGFNADRGTQERPACADYVDAVMPLISEHIDGTGHPVRVWITTMWSGWDERSSTLIGPRQRDRDAA